MWAWWVFRRWIGLISLIRVSEGSSVRESDSTRELTPVAFLVSSWEGGERGGGGRVQRDAKRRRVVLSHAE